MRWITTATALTVVLVVAGVMVARRPDGAGRAGGASSLELFQARLGPGDLRGWNLLLITLDTTRHDHLGCYGYAAAETPNIDALAARGALFEHAVTDVPATLPAHATILTGLETPSHGVRTNGHFQLDDGATTIAELLHDAGYATAAFVNTFVLDKRYGLSQGFDLYDGLKREKGEGVVGRRADRVTDLAIRWLNNHLDATPGEPWFAWVHYFDPHKPYDPPGEFAQRFASAPYDGEIAFTDVHVGRLLDYLEDQGQAERTLVILTADHGEGLGEHGEPDHSRFIYDTTIRVPLIIACPPLYEAPCRIDDVHVGNLDLAPTALSLLGIDHPPMDGLDLATATVAPDRRLYIETLAPLLYHGWSSLHGLRCLDGKFIEAPHPEYYDLRADPGELQNLFETDVAAGVQLALELDERLAAFGSLDDAVAQAAPLSATARRTLGALGYVSTADPNAPAPSQRPDPKDIYPLFYDMREKDPPALYEMCLERALPPGREAVAYRRALILAEAVCERAPERAEYRTGLGMAHYRLDDHEAALAALAEAAPGPRTTAFRAMALARLGRAADAQAQLAVLRTQLDASTDHAALLEEVQATVEAPP